MKNYTQINLQCAKLDGFENIDVYIPNNIFEKSQIKGTKDGLGESNDTLGRDLIPFPNYSGSYDAILPLINKQNFRIKTEILVQLFDCGVASNLVYKNATDIFKFTPLKLCKAFIKAKEIWD